MPSALGCACRPNRHRASTFQLPLSPSRPRPRPCSPPGASRPDAGIGGSRRNRRPPVPIRANARGRYSRIDRTCRGAGPRQASAAPPSSRTRSKRQTLAIRPDSDIRAIRSFSRPWPRSTRPPVMMLACAGPAGGADHRPPRRSAEAAGVAGPPRRFVHCRTRRPRTALQPPTSASLPAPSWRWPPSIPHAGERRCARPRGNRNHRARGCERLRAEGIAVDGPAAGRYPVPRGRARALRRRRSACITTRP